MTGMGGAGVDVGGPFWSVVSIAWAAWVFVREGGLMA